ncbi:MAG: FGGY family carbohydrate kinase [Ardenticatenaceae bacterium]|nr:FGGY family carbohydrate kinase [Ardenticatenaceae bacterium]
MTEPLILVIDQGTHATRALVFDEDGRVRAEAFCEIALRGSGTALVEQDATEIVASVRAVVQKVLADATVQRLGWAGRA